jgi:hypothetical protein
VPAAFRTLLEDDADADEGEERPPSHAVIVAVTGDGAGREAPAPDTNAVLRLSTEGRVFHINDNNRLLFAGEEGDFQVSYRRPDGDFGRFSLRQWIATPSPLLPVPPLQPEKLAIVSPKTTDVLQIRPAAVPEGLCLDPRRKGSAVRAAYYSAAFLLIHCVADELMIDETELEVSSLFLDRLPEQGSEGEPIGVLYLNDRLPNGAGFTRWIAREAYRHFSELLSSILGSTPTNRFAADLVSAGHADACDGRCPRCLQNFRNMNYHGLLDWRLGLALLHALKDANYDCGLDGTSGGPELRDWVARAEADRNLFCAAFPDFRPVKHGALPALENGAAVWLVVHPLWAETSARPDNVLAVARAAARAAGKVPRNVDAFNLHARPAWVRYNLLGEG